MVPYLVHFPDISPQNFHLQCQKRFAGITSATLCFEDKCKPRLWQQASTPYQQHRRSLNCSVLVWQRNVWALNSAVEFKTWPFNTGNPNTSGLVLFRGWQLDVVPFPFWVLAVSQNWLVWHCVMGHASGHGICMYLLPKKPVFLQEVVSPGISAQTRRHILL